MTEFDDVIRLLQEGRPQATELELDAIKQRVRRRAARDSGRTQSMKSRFAILGMLVLGMLFSTAGAGLALSGLSGNDASVAQYGAPTPESTPPAQGGVLPAEEKSPSNAPTEAGGVSPAEESGVQPTRQEEAGVTTSQLPFTGFAAIPVLVGGLALLGGGLFLRRRTRAE